MQLSGQYLPPTSIYIPFSEGLSYATILTDASITLPFMINWFRFTKEGVLVEGLLWKDVEGLIDGYAKEPKKAK